MSQVKLVNHREAVEFWESIPDPTVQALIQQAHSLIFTVDSRNVAGEFDLLLFYRVLEAFLRDRERLGQALAGEQQEHPWVAD